MNGLKEILIGYCDPGVLAISERPIGENGLTRRLSIIAYMWEIMVAMGRQQCYRFGISHFGEVFSVFTGGAECTWLTEVLRVMDKPSIGGRENLTVALCHKRFQAEAAISLSQRQEEQRLYDVLLGAYVAAGLRDFRNRQMFHLDLNVMVASSGGTGSVDAITKRLVEWFKHVGTVVYGGEPFFVTAAHRNAKRVAREFRRMMVARVREQKVEVERWRAAHPEQDGDTSADG